MTSKRLWSAVILLGFAALAVAAKLPVWLSPADHFGGTADAEQTMWFLTWIPAAVAQHHNPLLTTFLNYPAGINLMWNTAMPVLGVLLWPLTTTLGAVVSFNVITTAALALSAFFAFLAIRRHIPGILIPALGGLLYGFSPAIIPQDFSHANVAASAATIPLALILLDELLIRQRWRWWLTGLLIAALGVFQFFLFEEVFVTEVGAAVVLTLVLAAVAPDEVPSRRPYALRAFSLAAVITVACVAAPLAVQFAGPSVPQHSINDPNAFSIDLLNPVVPTATQLITPATSLSAGFSGNGSEADGYLGVPLLVLLVITALRCWRVRVVRAAVITGVIALVCSLGPNLHVAGRATRIPLPWWIPGHVPLLRSIIPARMMLFAFLAAALLLAYALHMLWSARRNPLPLLAVAAVVLVPLVPRLPLLTNTLQVPAFFSSARVAAIPAGTPVLAVPWPETAAPDAMRWQMASTMRFRLLGGHFIGPAAGGQDLLRGVAGSFDGAQVLQIGADEQAAVLRQLRDNNVGAVVVGPCRQHAAAVAFFTSLLGGPPSLSGDGADVWLTGSAGG
ncbi:MAG: hypothetical protein JOZ46_03655 [Candidatus Dormibacteraeota bacterium]|nr:hypothetical protein [Candidatus Dormibacteraeota bacterium]MBV9524897.1 hypothetical protein [Candidatus Dormibacteraeota bacterium]